MIQLAALVLLLAAPPAEVQAGDLIFHTSRSSQATAIFAASESPFTHVGVVVEHEGRLQVFEAKRRAGFTPIKAFLKRGQKGQYAHYRPRSLDDNERAALSKAALELEGRPYDVYFAPGEKQVYCSELVDIVLKAAGVELGGWRPTGELKLDHPAVRALLKKRWRGHPSCAGLSSSKACLAALQTVPILTPGDMAASAGLERIATTY